MAYSTSKQRANSYYQQGIEELTQNKEKFADFLEFMGRLYKLEANELIGIYNCRPNVKMLATYNTWKKYGKQVQKNEKGIPVFGKNGTVIHYFDFNQTDGKQRPYQWRIDKDTSVKVLETVNREHGRAFKTFTNCFEGLASTYISDNLDKCLADLKIKREDTKAFKASLISITSQIIAARCEYRGSYKYNRDVDLSAYDIALKGGNDNVVKLLTFAGEAAKNVLLKLEKTVNEIYIINNERGRTNETGERNNLVGENGSERNRGLHDTTGGRSRADILPTVHGGGRNNVQTQSGAGTLLRGDGVHGERGGERTPKRTGGNVREEVASVYERESPRGSANSEMRTKMGDIVEEDRRGSVGLVLPAERPVHEEESPAAGIREPLQIQHNDGLLSERRSDERDSSPVENGITNEIPPVETENNRGDFFVGDKQTTLDEIVTDDENDKIETPQNSGNYQIDDMALGVGSVRKKYERNINAIKTLNKIENEGRTATPEEQEVLSQYVGWGGIPEVFDPKNSDWSKEYIELKELLNDKEYRKAAGSVLNAHYTSPVVIETIYSALQSMGLTDNAKILEPSMGVGNFFGLLPEDLKNADLYGVELDDITGRIAKQLYPGANIQITGFENTAFPDNYFDVAVGNVPFGNYSLFDNRYKKENFMIHDYFFAKSIDKIKAGGIVAFVTSKGTLDKKNSKVREYIAERTNLIGAIRLPNNAFKSNANTEVTTDIIFLQKREAPALSMPDWCYTVPLGVSPDDKLGETQFINSYFADNPHMVLGDMKIVSGRYGYETACLAKDGESLKDRLSEAVKYLRADINTQRINNDIEELQGIIPAIPEIRNYTHGIVKGALYYRDGDKMKLVEASKAGIERLSALHDLRIQMRNLIEAQGNNCTDTELSGLQNVLNVKYDNFVKKHGFINNKENRKVFGDDDDYNLLCSLEEPGADNKSYKKASIFTQRTIRPTFEITSVETVDEAFHISLDRKGKIDLDYISSLTGKEPEVITKELISKEMIYKNPLKAKEDDKLAGYEETSEYLSGNIREKLSAAKLFAKDDTEYNRNVMALEKTLPPLIEAQEISVRIGASWIDVADYEAFLKNLAGKTWDSEKLRRTMFGEYKIEGKGFDYGNAATIEYGTKRMSLYYIFENLLNQRDVVVRDKEILPDGKETYVINRKETQLATEKARVIKEEFSKWLWSVPERREKYVQRYNELFNSIVGRKYDGSHQTFEGMNANIELGEHQKSAVARAKYGGNTLLAHCVGAGKSFEMFASIMEKKRLGLINKACVVVPKALVGQTALEWQRLYPNAHIFAAGEKDFQKDNRQKFQARCATGNYDGIVMSYEQFGKIPMSREYRESFINDELDKINELINELGSDDRATVKDLQRKQKSLETRLKKLIESSADRKDTALDFEHFGFDFLVVDEAHNFKNGLVVSKMSNVSGVSTQPAQKSEDILMKCNWLNDKYGYKNILFATGTPVSNSMTELYIMKNYLRPDLLNKAGLQTFDDWAANFGEIVSQLELKPAGDGFRTKKRFAKFTNLPELMSIYKEFADIRTPEDLKLPTPELKDGKPQVIVAKPSDFQQDYMKILAERAESVHNGNVDPHLDNMLKITHEARLLGLDGRTINTAVENAPNGKVNLCVDKVMEIYKETTEQKGVQAIFCDIAVNSDKGHFSVYEALKEEFIKQGIPEKEICFASEAKDVKQRNELFAKIRNGDKRIVIASTSKLGTGANIQKKLAALHHLDIPWRPSDLEQRNGRILRQGNEFPEVGIFNYITEGTFDAYMLNIITTKQKFISQLMNDKTTARTCEDVDELVITYSEMQALASGDPRVKERIELGNKVSELRVLEAAHLANTYKMQDAVKHLPTEIARLKALLTEAGADLSFAENNKTDDFKIKIRNSVFDERVEADTAISKEILVSRSKCVDLARTGHKEIIGEFNGFEVGVRSKTLLGEPESFLFIKGRGDSLIYESEAGIVNGSRNAVRIENILSTGIEKKVNNLKENISQKERDLEVAERHAGEPFKYASELKSKLDRMAELDEIFSKPDEVIVDEKEEKEITKKQISQDRTEPKTKKQHGGKAK